MHKQFLFFDFDGTLVDSGPGIFYSVRYALEHMGLPPMTDVQLRRFVGPPLDYSFKTFCGLEQADAERAVKLYREIYQTRGIKMAQLYPGILQTLQTLHDRGKTLYVATSKPEPFAREMLVDMGAAQYFSGIFGATFDGVRHTKEDVLRYALKMTGVTDLQACLMIGDRYYDVEGAHAVGMQTLGVSYGFGNRQELEQAGAVSIADAPQEICGLV